MPHQAFAWSLDFWPFSTHTVCSQNALSPVYCILYTRSWKSWNHLDHVYGTEPKDYLIVNHHQTLPSFRCHSSFHFSWRAKCTLLTHLHDLHSGINRFVCRAIYSETKCDYSDLLQYTNQERKRVQYTQLIVNIFAFIFVLVLILILKMLRVFHIH